MKKLLLKQGKRITQKQVHNNTVYTVQAKHVIDASLFPVTIDAHYIEKI